METSKEFPYFRIEILAIWLQSRERVFKANVNIRIRRETTLKGWGLELKKIVSHVCSMMEKKKEEEA